MSDVVVDESLAIKWVLLEQDSDIAAMLLDRWTNEGKEIIAPALFTYEVTNILHRRVLTSKVTYEEAKKGLIELFTIPISLDFSEYENISVGAMEFAHRFDLAAACSFSKWSLWTCEQRA